MSDTADTITRLAARVARLETRLEVDPRHPYDGLYRRDETIRGQDKRIEALAAENERLRAALNSIMIGGNHLAIIIGADHPPYGTPYAEVWSHYEGGVKYEAWCCWNSIMQARAALSASQPAPRKEGE